MSWLCDKWYNSSPGYCNNISSRYSFCWFAWWYSWTYYCGSYKIRYAWPEQAFCEWGRPITQWSTRQWLERPSIPIIPVAKRLEAHLVKWSMKKGNSNYTFYHINLWLFTVIHLFSSTFGRRFELAWSWHDDVMDMKPDYLIEFKVEKAISRQSWAFFRRYFVWPGRNLWVGALSLCNGGTSGA